MVPFADFWNSKTSLSGPSGATYRPQRVNSPKRLAVVTYSIYHRLPPLYWAPRLNFNPAAPTTLHCSRLPSPFQAPPLLWGSGPHIIAVYYILALVNHFNNDLSVRNTLMCRRVDLISKGETLLSPTNCTWLI